jgi:hypothetical protein
VLFVPDIFAVIIFTTICVSILRSACCRDRARPLRSRAGRRQTFVRW